MSASVLTFGSRAVTGVALGVPSVALVDLDDRALVERAREGDTEAFGVLVRRHEGRVRGLLRRLTRGNASVADDLAQDVFLRAWRAMPAFEGRAAFSTWTYRIATNVFLNYRERTRIHEALPEERAGSSEDSGFARPSTIMASSQPCCSDEVNLRNDLASAVEQLPDGYRLLITMHYFEELAYHEIAEVLELPLGTVKTQLHRAKKRLREHMQGWHASTDAQEG